MSNNVFLQRGSTYRLVPSNFTATPVLDDGIYQTCFDLNTNEIFLNRIGDKFSFDFKLYGVDETLVNHVINTYTRQESKRNIGVLLNGAKGTGKTVTAKVLANKLGLPIIICDEPFPGLSNFLSAIEHDCIFFFDEFEKNFRKVCDDDNDNCAGESLLSIMDGVYNNGACHIFLLTTNELKINDNLLSRPSRIRYLKSFGNVIDRKILEEYVDDNLKYPEYKQEIFDFIDGLTIATIDIVKSIVDEVNIHHCSVSEFKNIFNVKEAIHLYYVREWFYTDRSDEKDKLSKEKFLELAKGPYNRDGGNVSFTTIKTKKPLTKYNVGDILNNENREWVIKEIDRDNSYLLLGDDRRGIITKQVFVDNFNDSHTLYDSKGNIRHNINNDDDFEW